MGERSDYEPFFRSHFGSSAGIELQHRVAQVAALSRLFAACNGMGPGQGQLMNELMGERGEASRQVGPPTKAASPHPRFMARPSCTGRGMELHLWVYIFAQSLCVLFLQKAKAGGQPEAALKQQIKAATEEPVENSGRCPQRSAGSEASIAFSLSASDQKRTAWATQKARQRRSTSKLRSSRRRSSREEGTGTGSPK